MKEIWQMPGSAEMARPWPYHLAKERGWITADTFYDVPLEPTGRTNARLDAMLYEPSPFFGLIKKTDWSAQR